MNDRSYQNQFDPCLWPPDALLVALRVSGWQDMSWGNDTAPCWYSPGNDLVLWCDAEKPEDREDQDLARCRYNFTKNENHDFRQLMKTDDLALVIATVKTYHK